ncbi:MAG: hypothetical protein RIC55_10830 [Pirellulaceae bacterium]
MFVTCRQFNYAGAMVTSAWLSLGLMAIGEDAGFKSKEKAIALRSPTALESAIADLKVEDHEVRASALAFIAKVVDRYQLPAAEWYSPIMQHLFCKSGVAATWFRI